MDKRRIVHELGIVAAGLVGALLLGALLYGVWFVAMMLLWDGT